MAKKIGFLLLWLVFISYAFIFAPSDRPETWNLIYNLSTGQITGINPIIIALFNLMGIWPMIYSCVLFFDGKGQKIPAWPFAVLSFGVGAFAILPYLALRQPNPEFFGKKNLFLKLLDSRWTSIVITLLAITMLTFGISAGNWQDFIQQWQNSRFIHVMSLDFCLLSLVFPALLKDDMARRGLNNPQVFWIISLIPFLGALAYLCFRPPLPEITTKIVANN